MKRVFLESSQNSQENTSDRATFKIRLQASALFNKVAGHRCFPVSSTKFLRTLCYRTPLVAVSNSSGFNLVL